MKRHLWVSIGLVAGIVAAILPLVALEGPSATLLVRAFLNFGHIPLFGLIATLLLLLIAQGFSEKLAPVWHYGGAFSVALILGGLTELYQMIGPRDADFWDLARNFAGAALALVWCGTFDRRLDSTTIRRGNRVAYRAGALILGLIFLAPAVGVWSAYRERTDRFPVLFSFETASQASFMYKRLAWFEFISAPDGWPGDPPERVAHVIFGPLGGGALVFNEPHPDWSGHAALVLELFHPGERTIEVALRIDDEMDSERYQDRFNRRLFLEPGFNRIRIPMEEILAGPAERELDTSSIDRLILFAVEPVGGYEVFLGPLRLEPGKTATSS